MNPGIKKQWISKKVISVITIILFIVIVLLSFLFLNNKPTDITIIKDFAKIQIATDNYYRINKKLPVNLGILNITTAKIYEYKIAGDGIYKLCTEFSSDVSEDVNNMAGISVLYKKGYDCVVFNAKTNSNIQGINVPKIDYALEFLNSTFTILPAAGITQDKLQYIIDNTQSVFYKNNTTGDYLVNLFITIFGGEQCANQKVANNEQCCYRWNKISAISNNGIKITHNKLGANNYIVPFMINEKNNFGDLPVSFCLSGTKQISGGLSLIIPAKAFQGGVAEFSLKIEELEKTPATFKIVIKTK
jgi:hypothetical protein